MAARKLRVATPDTDDALQRVQDGFEEATGLSVEPEFQEIEHGALIIEMVIDDSPNFEFVAPNPTLVTRAVERSDVDMDVLSTWIEDGADSPGTPLPLEGIVRPFGPDAPEVAERAARDRIATAIWHRSGSSRPGRWQLAVPFSRADRSTYIAISERTGYQRRFGAHEVTGLRDYLRVAI